MGRLEILEGAKPAQSHYHTPALGGTVGAIASANVDNLGLPIRPFHESRAGNRLQWIGKAACADGAEYLRADVGDGTDDARRRGLRANVGRLAIGHVDKEGDDQRDNRQGAIDWRLTAPPPGSSLCAPARARASTCPRALLKPGWHPGALRRRRSGGYTCSGAGRWPAAGGIRRRRIRRALRWARARWCCRSHGASIGGCGRPVSTFAFGHMFLFSSVQDVCLWSGGRSDAVLALLYRIRQRHQNMWPTWHGHLGARAAVPLDDPILTLPRLVS